MHERAAVPVELAGIREQSDDRDGPALLRLQGQQAVVEQDDCLLGRFQGESPVLLDPHVVVPGWELGGKIPSAIANKFADLGPYLSGDKVKAYPNLAAIPTGAWQRGIFAGRLRGIPMPAEATPNITPFYRADIFEEKGYEVPTTTQEFYDLCKEINAPRSKVWACSDMTWSAFVFFGVLPEKPYYWQLVDGKLVNRYETQEYLEALEWSRSLYSARFAHPDAKAETGDMRTTFSSGNVMMYNADITDALQHGRVGRCRAYGLSRPGSVLHRPLLLFMLATMFFGAGLIPTYLVVQGLGLTDSYLALILPSALNVFNILVLRAFFMSTAQELVESARIDELAAVRVPAAGDRTFGSRPGGGLRRRGDAVVDVHPLGRHQVRRTPLHGQRATWAEAPTFPKGGTPVADPLDPKGASTCTTRTRGRSSSPRTRGRPSPRARPGSLRDVQFRIAAAPGRSGDLWLSAKDNGLLRSNDGGRTFTPVAGPARPRTPSASARPPREGDGRGTRRSSRPGGSPRHTRAWPCSARTTRARPGSVSTTTRTSGVDRRGRHRRPPRPRPCLWAPTAAASSTQTPGEDSP
ncbi:hypothetical protein SBADM41S_06836 [Streptomyces badius]